MPAPSWSGHLRISLVIVPLRAYSASSSGPAISLNQLHRACHSRIRYQKTCPIHGEVPDEEIVHGYEYAKDHYVVIEREEIAAARGESDKTISVDAFVPAEAIDPIYFAGTAYYLVPDGVVGQRPYALIRDAMTEEQNAAVGRAVIGGKERLVLVRPVGKLLSMSTLQYTAQLKQPSSFHDELGAAEPTEEELELTKRLAQAMRRDDLPLSEYTDLYAERLRALIESKVKGRELVAPPPVEEPQIVNLMDALKASVQRIAVPKEAEKPGKKMAASAGSRAKQPAAKKRKSG